MNILALACFNTGDRFLERAKERGARVWLLTKESFLNKKPWRRDLVEDVLAEPDGVTMAQTIRSISWLVRTIRFDRIVPFDDVEVEAAAHLREHLRVPGMGDTRARVFRDKLSMRVRAEEAGILVPPFVGILHWDDVRAFTERVPAPWMLKPRMEAASTGIRKIESAEQLWEVIESLGDESSQYLLEKYLPGTVGHVDSIVSEGKIVFSEVHANGLPPFDVSHGGGVFSTYTLDRASPDWAACEALNQQVLKEFGYVRGVSHLEYIRSAEDGRAYFLEAGARVGGAHVADVVEAATGINLWSEWADVEIDKGDVPYVLPPRRSEYAGLVQCLARSEHPDLSRYADREISYRSTDPFHAGLIVRSPSYARVRSLLDDYTRRFAEEVVAVLPQHRLPQRR
jgi:hypothetical protein